jgi:Amt family ammonium transporter
MTAVTLMAFLIFQTVFCATAATIFSGAKAERTKFISYCVYSAIKSLIVYPVSGTGYGEAAGLAACFMTLRAQRRCLCWAGVTALVGAKKLGPRLGTYAKTASQRRY